MEPARKPQEGFLKDISQSSQLYWKWVCGVVGSCQEVSSQALSQDLTSPFAGHTLPRGRSIPALKNQLRDFFVLHVIGKTNSSRRGRSLHLHHFVQAPLSYEGLRPHRRCCLGTVSTPRWAVEDPEGGVGYRSPRSVSPERPAAVSSSALSAALLTPRPLSP